MEDYEFPLIIVADFANSLTRCGSSLNSTFGVSANRAERRIVGPASCRSQDSGTIRAFTNR